jgi:two-component system cell cycle sensor histidine kinase/response regulator CckA
MPHLNVLIVEDSDDDAQLTLRTLSKGGWDVRHRVVSDPASLSAALRQQAWDVVLSDHNMPHFDALDALALVRRESTETPFIIVSGSIGEEVAVGAMKAGASDYILKGKLQRLLPAIEREVREAAVHRDRKRAEEEVRWKSALLEAQANATIDGILVVDGQGRKLFQNRRYIELWKIPDHIVANNDDKQQVEFVKNHAKDPEKFVERIVYLYSHPDEISRDEVELNDGTVLDWYSAPVIGQGGTHFGRIWVFRDITERKRAEEALRQSEERFRILFEQAADIILQLEMTPEGMPVIREANSATFRLLGFERDELIGRPVSFIDAAPDASHVIASRRQNILFKTGTTFEVKHRCKDGTIRDFECSVTEMQIGSKTYAVSVERDVTDRKRAEHDREASETRYRRLFESAKDGILILDADTGKIMDVNPFLTELTGYSHEVFLGKHLWEIGPFRDIAASKTSLAELQSKQYVRYEHLPLETRDGRKIAVEFVSNVYRVDNQSVIQCNIRDITERKRAEKELLETQQRMESVLEITKTGLDIIDREFNLIYVDPGWQKVYGNPAGRKCHEYFMGLQKPCAACAIPKAIETRQIQVTEETLPRENNRVVEVHTIPFQDASGQWMVAELNVDVTARKRAEKKLQETQGQLLQAQKMEAVGRLAGGVAHDFNNILTVILGYAETLLRASKDADPHRKPIEEIRNAGQRAAGLTRQLLAFSRRQILEPRVLNLGDVVRNLEPMLRRLIGEDIDLRTALPAGLGRVKADPGQIEQVLMNLAVNARDAMAEGGKLTIDAANADLDEDYAGRRPEAKPGRYVMLAVTDDGAGMTPEIQRRLFEPFFTTKEQGRGTGLGLSTVYGIVKQSGGHIAVYSEVGRGTTFKIYLPRVEEAAEPISRPRMPAVPSRGTETILVAEDEKGVRDLLRILLQENGYTVLDAADGEQALRVCERHAGPLHLLISDVVMPEMGGKQLAERLRKLRPGLKILFTSGYTANAIVHQGILDPGIAFIYKPYDLNALLAKVREVLDAPAR